jgi:hypothetical protein
MSCPRASRRCCSDNNVVSKRNQALQALDDNVRMNGGLVRIKPHVLSTVLPVYSLAAFLVRHPLSQGLALCLRLSPEVLSRISSAAHGLAA